MGMFREFGAREDSAAALKTLEHTVRRVCLGVYPGKFPSRMGDDASAMERMFLPLCQGLGAVVE
eukprot:8952228-Lingulodinium_polyedra.AAC.1